MTSVLRAGALFFSAVLGVLLGLASRLPGGAFAKLRRARASRGEALQLAEKFRRESGTSPRCWVHVASSGELEQALVPLEELRRARPDLRVFLTYFSSSGARGAELETQRRAASQTPVPWEASAYLPFDGPFRSSRFVAALAPHSALWVRSELWPWSLRALAKRRVPVALFAAAARAGASLRARASWYRQLAGVATVDTSSAHALASVGVTAEPLGDPRVDRVTLRRARHRDSYPRTERSLVLASLWEEDWEAVLPSVVALLRLTQDCRLFLVPHEPSFEFAQRIERDLALHGLPAPLRWREGEAFPTAGRAVLVARVGVLAELYAAASCAFVGGSFRRKVHNVLEPAAYRCALFTGPFVGNAPEAAQLRQLGALTVVEPGEKLAWHVEAFWSQEEERRRKTEALEKFFAERSGAGERVARWLLPWVSA